MPGAALANNNRLGREPFVAPARPAAESGARFAPVRGRGDHRPSTRHGWWRRPPVARYAVRYARGSRPLPTVRRLLRPAVSPNDPRCLARTYAWSPVVRPARWRVSPHRVLPPDGVVRRAPRGRRCLPDRSGRHPRPGGVRLGVLSRAEAQLAFRAQAPYARALIAECARRSGRVASPAAFCAQPVRSRPEWSNW